MPYFCTYVSKEVRVDNYETGCETERVCTMAKRCDVGADTVPELLKAIGERYGLDVDDLFIPGDDDDDITHVGFNRNETADGYEPTERELKGFKRGTVKLWLADYTFAVEYRETRPLRLEEISAAGIKTH